MSKVSFVVSKEEFAALVEQCYEIREHGEGCSSCIMHSVCNQTRYDALHERIGDFCTLELEPGEPVFLKGGERIEGGQGHGGL